MTTTCEELPVSAEECWEEDNSSLTLLPPPRLVSNGPHFEASSRKRESLRQYSAWKRSAAEEIVNAATHGFGLMLAIVGALVMAVSVLTHGDLWRVLGCGVFVVSLMAVYAASTLSHGCTSVRWKAFYRRLDQGFIYLLIVATYTPFGLAYFRTSLGWLLLAALWSIALFGFLSKVVFGHRVHASSVWTYIALGWLPVIAAPAIVHSVPLFIGWWMLLGGVCYTLGTLFLIFDSRIRHFHAVWHLMVIAGSTWHFLAILASVARAG